MMTPKSLTLVTSFYFPDSFPWFLWSYSPFGPTLIIHMLITPRSLLSAQTVLLSCMPHTRLPIGQPTSHRHVSQDFQNRAHRILPPTPTPPASCLMSWGFCLLRLLCLDGTPLPLDPLAPSPGCYSSFRSQVRCHFFWETFLDISSLRQVILRFQQLPLVILD